MAAVFQGIGAAAALPPAEKFHSQSRGFVSGSLSLSLAPIHCFFHQIFLRKVYSLLPNRAFGKFFSEFLAEIFGFFSY